MSENESDSASREEKRPAKGSNSISSPKTTDHSASDSESQSADAGVVRASFSLTHGPLPPPEVLRVYQELDPSFPNRIVTLAEDEAKHRRKIEEDALHAEINERKTLGTYRQRGQLMAFVLAIAFGAAGVGLTVSGYEAAGATVLGTTIVSLVALFVTGRFVSRRVVERRQDVSQHQGGVDE